MFFAVRQEGRWPPGTGMTWGGVTAPAGGAVGDVLRRPATAPARLDTGQLVGGRSTPRAHPGQEAAPRAMATLCNIAIGIMSQGGWAISLQLLIDTGQPRPIATEMHNLPFSVQ